MTPSILFKMLHAQKDEAAITHFEPRPSFAAASVTWAWTNLPFEIHQRRAAMALGPNIHVIEPCHPAALDLRRALADFTIDQNTRDRLTVISTVFLRGLGGQKRMVGSADALHGLIDV
jgi:hypothetical protein